MAPTFACDTSVRSGVRCYLPLVKALDYTRFEAVECAQARSCLRTAPRGS